MIKYTFCIFALFCFLQQINAQICTENYNSSQNWTHNGANNTISIQNGKLTFAQTHSSPDDEYITRPIGFALSDTKWQMDFEFTPTAGAPTGVAHLITSLTSNTADPLASSWEPTVITDNSTISVFYDSEFGANSSDYFIKMAVKAKRSQYISPDIHIVCPPLHTYYIRVERTAANLGIISVFSDAACTQHQAGSPVCFGVSPEIKGLQYVQHGVFIPGHNDRALTGSIDDLRIENNKNSSVMRDFKPIINGNPFICSGGTVMLTAHNAAFTSYLWSDGSTGSILNPAQAGVYTVTVTSATAGCGGGTNQITVTNVKPPNLRILGHKIACKGSLAQIMVQDTTQTIPNATRYTWNNGSQKDTLRVSEGNYSVTATNQYGCTAVAVVTIVAGAPLVAPILAVEGKHLSVYNPQPNYIYEWQQNGRVIAQANSEKYTVKKADLYQVCVKNAAGCRDCSAAIWVGLGR